MIFIDQFLEELARGRLLRQVVLRERKAFFFEVGDRLPAARSTRLEVDVDFFHRLRINDAKNERGGLANRRRGALAADFGSRSAGSFLESENWRSDTGRGMRGLFTVDAMISLEF
jgi:hypothetical protein